jgi:hypothetical protein
MCGRHRFIILRVRRYKKSYVITKKLSKLPENSQVKEIEDTQLHFQNPQINKSAAVMPLQPATKFGALKKVV